MRLQSTFRPLRHIPLLDLQSQHAEIRAEVFEQVARVIDSQKFILGEEVKQLEEELAAYTRTQFAVGCASGSDALYLALLAAGVEPGDRVVTTPFTFFATAGAISRAGAVPVFVDIEPDTFNMDMKLLAETLARSAPIRAIVPVHLFGGCADMDPLLSLAREHGCAVIEDAAQAIGAEYKGRRAGSMGRIGCVSFYPSKNLGGFGDGGMLFTSDEATARRLAALRVHGRTREYYHEWIGINSRLDALQAAVLRVKLRHLDRWTAQRQHSAGLYRRLLEQAGAPVVLPAVAPYQSRHVWNQFVVRCKERDRLRKYLEEGGVGAEVYYPLALHLQPCYQNLGYQAGAFPVSEQASAQVLSLPVHSSLAAEDVEYVCELIRSFYRA